MKPLGYHGDYVICQKIGPGPNSGRVFSIWSRWLLIHREKSLEEYRVSNNRHIPIIHEVERQGFMGRQIWDTNDRRVPALPGDIQDI